MAGAPFRLPSDLLRGMGIESLAEVAGELPARGHARSGDACVIHGECGTAELEEFGNKVKQVSYSRGASVPEHPPRQLP
jgi:hypothetical protein